MKRKHARKQRIACLGIMVLDMVGRDVTRLPDEGQLEFMGRVEVHNGGCAVNTGIALSRLGKQVDIAGRVGDDLFGDLLLRILRREKINTRSVKKDGASWTSSSFILVNQKGERSFLHSLGANAKLKDIDFPVRLLQKAGMVHMAGAMLMGAFDGKPMARVMKRAKKTGALTSLDTAWDPTGRWMKVLKPVLPHLDVFMPSIEEARKLSGKRKSRDVARMLRDQGPDTIVLKLGSEGSAVLDDDGWRTVPVVSNVRCVDTTGAGDSFAAGYLYGRSCGWDEEDCLRMGNVTGAMCVGAIGASTGIGNIEKAGRIFKRNYGHWPG